MIKQILQKLSCLHKWKSHNRTKVYDPECRDTPYEIKETLICQTCGKIKKIKL